MNTNSSKFILLIAIFMLGLTFSNNLFAKREKLIIEKKFDVNSGETLRMEVSPGDVIINTWDSEEVEVLVYANKKAEERLEFTIKKEDYGVHVKTEKQSHSWSFWNNMKVRFEIKVPKNFNSDIKTSGGDIKISNLSGKGEMKTSGGDIIISESTGNFNCSTSGGDIKVGHHNGSLRLGTSGGDIETRKIVGDVVAKTSGGDIKVELANGNLEAKTSGGDISASIADGFSGADLRTSGGDIDLLIPEGSKAELGLYTSGGDVDVDIRNARPDVEKSNKWEGSINGGGAKLITKTSGGDIDVRAK